MNNIDMLIDQLTAKTQPTIVQVSTDKLHPFPAHPFKVQDDEDMEQLTQSIQAQGVLTPLVIRPLEDGEYEVISGHRRLHACRKAGIATVPALVYAIDRDIHFFSCSNYKSDTRGSCETRHYIRADAIEQVVMWELQRIMIHYKFVGVIELPDDGDNYTADTRKGVAVEYVTQRA